MERCLFQELWSTVINIFLINIIYYFTIIHRYFNWKKIYSIYGKTAGSLLIIVFTKVNNNYKIQTNFLKNIFYSYKILFYSYFSETDEFKF